MAEAVRYTVLPARPEAHLFQVTCTVADPEAAGQRFSLPAWIPGSYLIRDFARHIVSLRAESRGRAVAVDKLDKHTWRAAPVAGPLSVIYEVYAWDLSVRGAHFDATHAFFNGTSLFLKPEGRETRPMLVELVAPAHTDDWRVATALPRAKGVRGAAKAYGFGLYRAADYEELIDHPVEMGSFDLVSFDAAGVRHDVAVTGRHDADLARLAADLKRVCAWQIALFGRPAPMDYYVFLVTVVGEGYGGLEHRASTALLAARDTLPGRQLKRGELDEGYKGFLGLASHEYFHTWNVKRIKPAAFVPYDLARENHTRLLWAFEGFTSYYDDLALVRGGVLPAADYLALLGKTLETVQRAPGRLKQSVAESSFDAWTKFYRQDENSPNSIVSYYQKGALIGLALDLRLRADAASSLDALMRVLWTRYGKTGTGVEEDGIYRLVAELAGAGIARWLRRLTQGTDELALAPLLARFGVELKWEAEARGDLGVRVSAEGSDAKLATVYDGGAAQRAGLAAGDVLVALDGLRVSASNWEKKLARRAPGERIAVHAFRRDELMQFDAVLDAPARKAKLAIISTPTSEAQALRHAWLGV